MKKKDCIILKAVFVFTCCLFVACLGLMIYCFSRVEGTNSNIINIKSEDQYDDRYYNGAYGINSNYYKHVYSKNIISIKNQSDFDNFIGAANFMYGELFHEAGKPGYMSKYMYDFKGKTVKLYTDVSTSKNVSGMFRGSFNGNGHTINNNNNTIATPIDYYYDDYDYINYSIYYGMFNCLKGGTISNVKFLNFYFRINSELDGTNKSYAGVIVGKNEGTITNCIVENCKFNSDRYDSDCFTAPIVGYNSGTISNCLVKGSHAIGANDGNGLLVADGIKAFTFKAAGTDVSLCVYDAEQSRFGVSSNEERRTFDDSIPANCCNSKETIKNLGEGNCNATGGQTATVGGHWYYASDYADMPLLRYFIQWKTIPIVAGPGAEVDKSTIKLPNDANKVYYSSSDKITIYNQTITATKKSGWCNHSSVKWKHVDVTDTYSVTYERQAVQISIYKNSKENLLNASNEANHPSCCSKISINGKGYTGSKNGAYETITISCGKFVYTYIAPKNYYISNYTNIQKNNINIDGKLDIVIEVKPKFYSVEIK